MINYIQEDNYRFGYFKVNTNRGKTFICVAIEKEVFNDGTIRYSAGFSFCSPTDRKHFSKKLAREIAFGRLNVGKYVFFDTQKENMSSKEIMCELLKKLVIVNNENIAIKSLKIHNTIIPRWLRTAAKTGNITIGLSDKSNEIFVM